MATDEQIAEVRVNTQEPDDTEPFTDKLISDLIDAHGVTGAERKVWIAKRNMAATLVDISEGGSSRRASQVFDNLSKIVASYGDESDASGGGTSSRASRTREITR